MPDTGSIHEAVRDLRSDEQVELLDAIDKLRRGNINADISIPQIVVCGDQSSGKSSVLEAIARVRFPRSSGTTTRFPIEVVLRNAATESTKVRLHPAPERHGTTQHERIKSFEPKADASDPDQFETVVQQAKDHLESVERNGEFWGDRLIVEIAGPAQPHLTLVDLPGLIHHAPANGITNNPRTIKEMTVGYLRNPRTIVLAVISALNDQANQQILSLVEATGSTRSRTMGVITKPDIVPKNPHDEAAVVNMACNNDVHLGLGWHVLKNVGHHEDSAIREKRDELERTFFSTGLWSSIDDENVGISTLRKKLSRSLLSSIKRDLPALLEEMQTKLSQCTRSLSQLGEGRESPGQQRGYLSRILSRLQRLIEAGLDGQYSKLDSDFFDGNIEKHLRDSINGEMRDFATKLRTDGKTFLIYHKLEGRKSTSLEYPPFRPKLSFSQPLARQGIEQVPHAIKLDIYCEALAVHMRERQGKHLRSHPSAVTPDVFRQQSLFWERITRSFVDRCHGRALGFIDMAVMHVAGKHTGDRLVQHYVEPAFEKKTQVLDDKISDLLWPYQKCHPVTYNPTFAYKISKENGYRYSDMINESGACDPDLVLAAEALDQAEAYYEIASNNFIDNVASLAIEKWLLDDMPFLIPPEAVWTMSDEEIEKIAAEPADSREKRKRLTLQVGALQEAMGVCRRHARHRAAGDVMPDKGLDMNDNTAGRTTQRTGLFGPRITSTTAPTISSIANGIAADGFFSERNPKAAKRPTVGAQEPVTSTWHFGTAHSDHHRDTPPAFERPESGNGNPIGRTIPQPVAGGLFGSGPPFAGAASTSTEGTDSAGLRLFGNLNGTAAPAPSRAGADSGLFPNIPAKRYDGGL